MGQGPCALTSLAPPRRWSPPAAPLRGRGRPAPPGRSFRRPPPADALRRDHRHPVPVCITPPLRSSHLAAVSGNRVPRSQRGSSRFELPQSPSPSPNSASRMTRRNTCPLARSAGVLSADTHRGSISSAITRGVRSRHRPAHRFAAADTGSRAARQPSAVRSKAALSPQLQPLAVTMPAAASSGAGQGAARGRVPSGKRRASGRRSSTRLGLAPRPRASRQAWRGRRRSGCAGRCPATSGSRRAAATAALGPGRPASAWLRRP